MEEFRKRAMEERYGSKAAPPHAMSGPGPVHGPSSQPRLVQLFGAWVGGQSTSSRSRPRSEPMGNGICHNDSVTDGPANTTAHNSASAQRNTQVARQSGDPCTSRVMPQNNSINATPTNLRSAPHSPCSPCPHPHSPQAHRNNEWAEMAY